jgi:hypothetical protein
MDRFLARRKFLLVFDAGKSVNGQRPRFPSLPHFSFIALTPDRAGKHLDLGETLLPACNAPANSLYWHLHTGFDKASHYLPDGGLILERRQRRCHELRQA